MQLHRDEDTTLECRNVGHEYTSTGLRVHFNETGVHEGNTTDIKPNCKLTLTDVKNGQIARMDWV